MATLVIVARVIDDYLEHARPKPWTIQRSLRNRTSHRNYDVEISLEYYVVNIREVLTHHLFKTGGGPTFANIVCRRGSTVLGRQVVVSHIP